MARITKPNEQVIRARGNISTEAATAPGRADINFGQQMSGIGKQYFQEAKAADQTAKYSKAYQKALVDFNTQAEERIAQKVDEEGNPTYETLSDDIGNLGNGVIDEVAGGIIDPEVAARFRNSFGQVVATRQVGSLATARSQQRQFAEESIADSLSTISNQAVVQGDTDLDLYIRQSDQILDSGVASGAISPQQRHSLAERFRAEVTGSRVKSLIEQDPYSALERLKEEGSADQFGLRENERRKYVSDAERQIQRIEAAQRSEQKAKLQEIKGNLKDVEKVINTGLDPGEDSIDNIINMTKGTPLEAEAMRLVEKKRVIQSFSTMSPNARQITLDKLKGQTTTAGQLEIHKTLSKVHNSIEAAKKDDIVGFHMQQGLGQQIAPLNLQDDLPGQLQQRRALSARIEAQYGVENSGLTKIEISTIKENLTKGTIQEQAVLMGQIVQGYGEKSYEVFSDLAKQGAIQQAYAGSLIAEGNEEAARLLLTGIDLRKNKRIEMPAKTDITEHMSTHGNLPQYGDPTQRAEMVKAATNAYAALAAEEGVFDGEFDADIMDKAIASVTNGGPIEVDFSLFGADSRVEPPVSGMTSSGFEAWINNLDDGDINRLGGFLHRDEGTAKELKEFKYKNAGRGQYFLFKEQDGIDVPILDKEGNPFILDYNALQAPPVVDTGPSDADIKQIEDSDKFINDIQSGTFDSSSLTSEEAPQTKETLGGTVSNFLRRIRPVVSSRAPEKVLSVLDGADDILQEFGITGDDRLKHFFAQISHESGGFRHMVEKRSDTSAERKYGVGTRVGRILGNTQRGDGAKYKGRGFIQLTGRDNYTRYGRKIGVDLVNNPEQAADPETALKIAAAYWESKGLNRLADQDNIREITRRINGGFNGFSDRKNRLAALKDL